MRRLHIFHFLGFLAWAILPWLPLFAAEGEGGGEGGQGSGGQGGSGGAGLGDKTGAGAGQGGQPGAAAVDVQAEVAKALAAHRDQFSQQLKAATGYDSLDKLQEELARKSGELDKLLAQRTEENGRLRQQLEQSQISTAILGAASDAVNPAELVELLKGKAKVSAEGVVTVDGKSPQDAVAAYLKANAHHAKPSGGQGSGAGAGAGSGQVNPWSAATFNLTEQGRIERENPSLAQTLKTTAAK